MQPVCTISNNPNYVYIFVGLFIFSIAYNAFVDYLERRGWERGVTAFLVAGGTTVTLAPLAWLGGWQLFNDIIGLFVASGTVMIGGSLYRYLKEREAETEAILRAQSLNDGETQ